MHLNFIFYLMIINQLKKKKINFNLWYDEKSLLWLKMSYEKLGQMGIQTKKTCFFLIGNKSCPIFSI